MDGDYGVKKGERGQIRGQPERIEGAAKKCLQNSKKY
jgi:hypothetical protein